MHRDIAHLQAAVAAAGVAEAFIPSASIGTVAQQELGGHHGGHVVPDHVLEEDLVELVARQVVEVSHHGLVVRRV